MSITGIDDVVKGMSEAQRSFFAKQGTGQQHYQSDTTYNLWTMNGFPTKELPPAYDSGGPYICNSSTPGALLYSNAQNRNYVLAAYFEGYAGQLRLLDRLWHCSYTQGGTRVVDNPGALPPRVTDAGASAGLLVEVYTIGSNNNPTIYYKDAAGASKSLAISIPNYHNGLSLVFPVGGVSQITSIDAPGSGGTYAACIVKHLMYLSVAGHVGTWANLPVTEIPNDACLQLLHTQAVVYYSSWGFFMGCIVIGDI